MMTYVFTTDVRTSDRLSIHETVDRFSRFGRCRGRALSCPVLRKQQRRNGRARAAAAFHRTDRPLAPRSAPAPALHLHRLARTATCRPRPFPTRATPTLRAPYPMDGTRTSAPRGR